MKKLGVIGGLGPMATVYFLQLLTDMSKAQTDQEHMEILVHMKPQIPDRTGYILGKSSENPLPVMAEAGRGLVRQGAEALAVPCVTAHYFREELERQAGVPVFNAIGETALCLKEAGIAQAGILATDGTIESGLVQKELEKTGIGAVLPETEGQAKIMRLIYENIKAGRPPEMELFYAVSEQLFRKGAQVILLACTELSLLKRDYPLGAEYLDVLAVLARKAVVVCGNLKEEFVKYICRLP